MKNIFLLCVVGTFLLGACSSAHKATTTPDEVYYSPSFNVSDEGQDRYTSYTTSNDDNYLRLKVQNRYQWDAIDDYAYWNDSRYDFGYSCFPSREVLLNPYNPYHSFAFNYYYTPWFGSWYNPYATVVYYKTPKAYYNNSGKTNLTAYKNGIYNSTNRSRSSFGNFLKQTFSGPSNDSYNSLNNTSRTFNPGFTPSSNAGGRSGGFRSIGSTPVPRSPR